MSGNAHGSACAVASLPYFDYHHDAFLKNVFVDLGREEIGQDNDGSTTLNAGSGLPRSGKKVWKMKFFPGQGKVREF